MEEYAVKNLAAAVMLQAVKDYFRTSEKGRVAVIKDLHSRWMREFTNGMSVIVADRLLKAPKEIKARMFAYESEDDEL